MDQIGSFPSSDGEDETSDEKKNECASDGSCTTPTCPAERSKVGGASDDALPQHTLEAGNREENEDSSSFYKSSRLKVYIDGILAMGRLAPPTTTESDKKKTDQAQIVSSPATDGVDGTTDEKQNECATGGDGSTTPTSPTELAKTGDANDGALPQHAQEAGSQEEKEDSIQLYKSSRLKCYITITLAAGLNFNAVQRSYTSTSGLTAVPSTLAQRQYGLAVSTINMVLSTAALICHIDRITPLERLWIKAFRPESRIELALVVFLALFNAVAVGVETTIGGIAGDGKGQFNIYFSIWILCLTSLTLVERWWVDCGWSSFRAFITSWPYRAPAWICIMFLSMFVLIWSVDNWRNLDYNSYLESVPTVQWQWFIVITVFTLCPAIAFVTIELFRDTKADGSTQEKSKVENIVEGVIFLCLVIAWIPTVGAVTTPNGAASLVGNSYFFTWLLVVFLFEGCIWWIHDYRYAIHQALKAKEKEYRQHQREVLAKTQELLRKQKAKQDDIESVDENEEIGGLSEGTSSIMVGRSGRERTSTEYFDTTETERY